MADKKRILIMNDKKIILVIEDDSMLLRLLAKSFRKEGFEVLEADNGQTGIEQAEQEHPDIIILDVILPKVDGVTVYKKLQASKAKIVIWTNLVRAEVEQAIGVKGIDYFGKAECSLERLISHVQGLK